MSDGSAFQARSLAVEKALLGKNQIHHATCNPAGGGFHRIVENQLDLDGWIGYPSVTTFYEVVLMLV